MAAAAAWLLARANPRLSALRMSTTCGNSAATMSAAPSAEPLSAITTSNDTPCGCSRSDWRQRRSRSTQFQLAMHTDTSGGAGRVGSVRSGAVSTWAMIASCEWRNLLGATRARRNAE